MRRSGPFCLGYPKAAEDVDFANHSHPLLTLKAAPMIFGPPDSHNETDRHFDCPRIHFVMSMIEDAYQPELIWISYGVSDCLSRMIQVRKSDIVQMLWPEAFAHNGTQS